MSGNSFRDLVVWQKAMDLVLAVYEETKRFPREEKYGLTNQIRRAAVSVPSNIAEGQARQGVAEFRNFLSIAKGSLAEVQTQVILAERLGFLESSSSQQLLQYAVEIDKMLSGLRSSLNHKL